MNIELQKNDDNNIEQQSICEQCWSKTNDFNRFYVNIESKQNELIHKTIGDNDVPIKREKELDIFSYLNIDSNEGKELFGGGNVANLVKCDDNRMAIGTAEPKELILETLKTKKENGKPINIKMKPTRNLTFGAIILFCR